jgi:hypothetical protein
VYGPFWNRRLLVLWGYERNVPEGSSVAPAEVMQALAERTDRLYWLKCALKWLGLLLLLLLLLRAVLTFFPPKPPPPISVTSGTGTNPPPVVAPQPAAPEPVNQDATSTTPRIRSDAKGGNTSTPKVPVLNPSNSVAPSDPGRVSPGTPGGDTSATPSRPFRSIGALWPWASGGGAKTNSQSVPVTQPLTQPSANPCSFGFIILTNRSVGTSQIQTDIKIYETTSNGATIRNVVLSIAGITTTSRSSQITITNNPGTYRVEAKVQYGFGNSGSTETNISCDVTVSRSTKVESIIVPH